MQQNPRYSNNEITICSATVRAFTTAEESGINATSLNSNHEYYAWTAKDVYSKSCAVTTFQVRFYTIYFLQETAVFRIDSVVPVYP